MRATIPTRSPDGPIGANFGRANVPEQHRILIVEDSFALRQQLVVLSQAVAPECLVIDAANLGDARLLASSGTLSLIATDLHLPDGDGIELATDLRQDHPEAAVIVISVQDGPGERDRAAQLGNARLLSKTRLGPNLPAALLEALYPPYRRDTTSCSLRAR